MHLTEQQTHRNILALRYLELINFGYLFAIPVMVSYIPLHTNGSETAFFEIAMWMSLVAVGLALFVGAYSDLYSRKVMLITSMSLKTACWILFAAVPSYETFFAGLIMYVTALMCCNTSACLYETMHCAGADKKEYRKLEQKMHAWPQYAAAVCLPISGFLYTVNPVYPFILNVIACAAAIVVACVYYTDAPREKVEHRSVLRLVKEAFSYAVRKPKAGSLLLYGALVRGFIMTAIFILQVRFMEVGGTVMMYSLLLPAIYFLRGFGADNTARLSEYLQHSDIKLLAVIFLASCGFMMVIGVSRWRPSVI